MEYKDFLLHMRDEVARAVPGAQVDLHHILKNNRVTLDGLTILHEGETISPTIYLEEFYEEYLAGVKLEQIVTEILVLYHTNQCKPMFEVGCLKNFEYIQDRVVFKLINYDDNLEFLRDVPHKRVLDLAMVFYFIVEDEVLGVATATISNSHMDLWGVTEEQLYQLARVNTPSLLGWELQSMDYLIDEMLAQDLSPEFEADEAFQEFRKITLGRERRADSPMYVLTNTERFNGAGCMLYQDVLDKFAKEQESDLYVLPSSIHEVIIIPCSKSPGRDELVGMVREINRTEVSVTDRLSDQVYRYSLEEGILKM